MTNKILDMYYRLKRASDDYYISDLAAEEHGRLRYELTKLGYNPNKYPWEEDDE